MPDAKGALLAYLHGNTELAAAFPNAVISGNLAGLTPGGFALAVVKSGGDQDLYAPLGRPRLDLHCYGPSPYEAFRFWRTVMAILIPADRRSFGWTAANCRVLDVVLEGGPVEMLDGEWPKVWSSVRLTISEVPL